MQDVDLLGRLDQLVNQGNSCIAQFDQGGNWRETATWFLKEFKVLKIQASGLPQSSLSFRVGTVLAEAQVLAIIISLY